MNKFVPVLFAGIFCIGLGIWMMLTIQPYNCGLLPKGYWDNTCKQFNIEESGVNLIPIGLGIFTIIVYFKLIKTEEPKPRSSII